MMATLIGLGMPIMWLVSTALVYFILDLPFWLAALIGAIITPTDPVASTPIVTGSLAEENIPDRLRHAISFDSGANDGLAFLFVFLPFLMMTMPVGDALTHWLVKTLLWDVVLATALGLLIGYVSGKLLRAANATGTIQSEWRLVYTVAVGFLAVGIGKLVQSDEVLVVFAAAAAFNQVVSASDRENEEQGQEAVNRFFSIPIFILLGSAIPWDGWQELSWKGVSLAIAILLLRRPLAIPAAPAVAGNTQRAGYAVRRLVRTDRRGGNLLCVAYGSQTGRVADLACRQPNRLCFGRSTRPYRCAIDPPLGQVFRALEKIGQATGNSELRNRHPRRYEAKRIHPV